MTPFPPHHIDRGGDCHGGDCHSGDCHESHGRHRSFATGEHTFRFHSHDPRGMYNFTPWGRAKRGDVRTAVLTMLAEEPMHGYQIIQRLEERSGGFWRPSAGSVYPTLQLLEDQGFVKSEEIEGKRVFSLTEAGRTEAARIKERAETAPWGVASAWSDDPRFKLGQAFMQLGGAAKQVGMSGTKEQVDEVLKILADARKRIYQVLAGGE